MIELPDYVSELVRNIAASEGFTVYKSDIGPGSNHGDNFMGIMISVVLTGSRNKNATTFDEKLHLLCKLAPSNAVRRQEFKSALIFQREAFMYNKILPLFAKFQKEKGLSLDESFSSYPKCYVAIADAEKDQLVIIMEDVRLNGFAMWSKKLPVPASHTYRVVEQLGKLHGISFALKDQRPDLYEELREVKDLWNRDNMEKMMQMGFNKAIAVLDKKEHIDILTDVRDNVKQRFEWCVDGAVCEPFGVIGQGDCWSNNLLYQYDEGTTETKAVCLVDWQLSRYGSPVLDLHYNIFGATDKEFRDKHYQSLMKHYHKSLSDIVTKLGSDPESLFSFADFQSQLKKFGTFAFLMGPMIIQMMLVDAEDIPDLDKLCEAIAEMDGNADFLKDFEGDTLKAYRKRINDAITDMVELDFNWK